MTDPAELLKLTTYIAASYLENNKTPAADVPALIISIHAALALGDAPSPSPQPVDAPTAASKLQIRKSITPDALISFEDGKAYKMLKPHLTNLGLTPVQYRQKWGLSDDYPLTAPNYSAARAQFARGMGLGRKVGRKSPSTPRKPKT